MWRTFKIRTGRDVRGFYAPDLMTAFSPAWLVWPCAPSLECVGSTN